LLISRHGHKFNYTPPASWLWPVAKAPIVLLSHFILGILFAAFLLFLLVALYHSSNSRVGWALKNPDTVTGYVTALMMFLVFAMIVGDAWLWSRARADAHGFYDFVPNRFGAL